MSTTALATEILENILLTFDPKSILLAQRVSKQFRNVIAGSQHLQAAIFKTPSQYDGSDDSSVIELNTFLHDALSHWYYVYPPTFPRQPPVIATRTYRTYWRVEESKTIIRLDSGDPSPFLRPTCLSVNGSQHDMLLSRTPATIEVQVDGRARTLPSGATFGNMMEVVEDFERLNMPQRWCKIR